MKIAGTNKKVSLRKTIVTCSPAYILAKRRMVSESGRAVVALPLLGGQLSRVEADASEVQLPEQSTAAHTR